MSGRKRAKSHDSIFLKQVTCHRDCLVASIAPHQPAKHNTLHGIPLSGKLWPEGFLPRSGRLDHFRYIFYLAWDLNPQTCAECMRVAFENGVNYFDTAESNAGGQSEIDMGMVFRKFGWKRSDLVVSTKIFWGGKGPNDRGLSRKHVIEGLRASLKRLQLTYVDIVFAHRPDLDTPMEEVVRAFNHVIDKGMAFYWGTSEWPAQKITEAHAVAQRLGLIAPLLEQSQYNMFNRECIEKEYMPLTQSFGMGLVTWSPLASGILTGKYNNGIPPDSRLALAEHPAITRLRAGLATEEGRRKFEKVRAIMRIAQNIGCTPAQLALAWCLRGPSVSAVIMGASRPEQVAENLRSLAVAPKLTNEIMLEIEAILQNKPEPIFNFRKS
ncbi:voltage-dependent potassium channel, beta subunit [Jimgerdemannia flammicorona]|uniref:Voltage-dependent potassium channel, beta subunit n=1 Tax=Jimgerdemannia flammicorona TaxID=994334 RepID=A0A433A0H0_9FUNG|nr:voltage-dependent potassium channel, beta subunit [Jimgerdemannia flammicorona]